MNIQETIEKNKKAIILIDVVIPQGENQSKISIKGTGFIISPDGRFITNAHVYKAISEEELQYMGASVPGETNNNLTKYDRFKIEKIDIDEENDIALMKIISIPEKKDFSTIEELGDSELLKEGDEIIYIGYPLAVELLNMGFGITMTTNKALVSSIKRRGGDGLFHFFLIDSHINSGSSGSPVFSMDGKVMGIASAKISAKIQIPGGPIADIPANMGICRPSEYINKIMGKNK